MSTRPPYLRVAYSAPGPARPTRADATPWPPHWSTAAGGASLHLVGSEPSQAPPEPAIARPQVLRLVRPEPPAAPAPKTSRLGVALVTMGGLITFGMAVAAAPLVAVPASAVIAAVVGLTLWG